MQAKKLAQKLALNAGRPLLYLEFGNPLRFSRGSPLLFFWIEANWTHQQRLFLGDAITQIFCDVA